MQEKILSEKKKLGIMILSIIVLIVTGTFAWTNFRSRATSQRFGTGATLHDYRSENGEYRQIHIENWGSEPLFVRIRLDEYMEIGSGAGLRSVDTDENTGESIPNPQNLAKPLIDGASIDDPSTWEPHDPTAFDPSRCLAGFHDFWEWEMGGQRYYFPAPEEYRTNKNFVDTSSPVDLTADSVNEVGVRARRTRFAQVQSLEWTIDGSPIGDFWVIDQDFGWAYWASPLNPGDSTGLLLSQVTQTIQPEEDYFYDVNVIAQMAPIDLEQSNNYVIFDDYDSDHFRGAGVQRSIVREIINFLTSTDIGIVVHTTFSDRDALIVDVTYTATPSKGAIITEVSYSINDQAEEFLYLADVDGMTAEGTLGAARVLLVKGENYIVFTTRDSAGNIANYSVVHWIFDPEAELGGIRHLDSSLLEPLSLEELFAPDRVWAVANPGVRMEQLKSAAETIGGRIVGHNISSRRLDIEVDRQTEEELRRICEKLMSTGLFFSVELVIVDITLAGID